MSGDPPRRRSPLRHLTEELEGLAAADLLRKRPPPRDRELATRVQLGSNDYLGYAQGGRLRAAAITAARDAWTGAGASRLVCGEHDAHRALELALAAWLRTESALVFTSGYAANVGALSALAGAGDVIVSDALNHASLIDGCRLSRARVVVVPHRSVAAVRAALGDARRARRRWVVTESLFSMDGDVADLAGLRDACDDHDAALYVDEAHALGVVGPEGRGHCAAAGVVPDVLVGTMGKALAAQGAFVAGSQALNQWLWNCARSFVFSTGLSPLLAHLARDAVHAVRKDDAARARVTSAATELRAALAAVGVPVAPDAVGAILPVVVGAPGRALQISSDLASQGIAVQAIRPPTVPEGSARLRVVAHALLTEDDIARASTAIAAAWRATA